MERLRLGSSPAGRRLPDPKAAAATRKRRSSKQGTTKEHVNHSRGCNIIIARKIIAGCSNIIARKSKVVVRYNNILAGYNEVIVRY
jgi:hypothetical protein